MEGPRRVRREEIEDLAELLAQVFGFDRQYPRERRAKSLARVRSQRGALVILEGGRPVSHIRTVYNDVSVFGCRVKVASIGAVATHPEYRGRGYAGAILRRSLEEMVKAGAKVLIVSGNRSLYRRAHCVPAGRVFEAELRRKDFAQQVEGVSARRVRPDDWSLLARLHQSEAVRFVRRADFFSKLVFWWDCEHPEVWLVESGGEPIAYAVLAREWGSGRESRGRFVSEYAGSRGALLDGLPAVFAADDLEAIKFRVLGHDRELVHLLRRQGIAVSAATLSGTRRLLDLPGLMRRLRPYVAARLTRAEMRRLSFDQEGERCLFGYGSERMELDLSKAATLVLGGMEAAELGGELGRALARVVPIPMPMPGFNYV